MYVGYFTASEKYKVQYQDMLDFLNKISLEPKSAENIINIYFGQTWKRLGIVSKLKLKLDYFLQPSLKSMDAEYIEFNSQILKSLLNNIQ